MRFAVSKLTTDTNQEDSSVLFTNSIFALFRSKFRIALYKLLSVDKSDLFWQYRLNIKAGFHSQLCQTNSLVNLFNRFFQVSNITSTIRNNLFPIPLINIDRVRLVKRVLIWTKCFHVYKEPFSLIKTKTSQGMAFPLR